MNRTTFTNCAAAACGLALLWLAPAVRGDDAGVVRIKKSAETAVTPAGCTDCQPQTGCNCDDCQCPAGGPCDGNDCYAGHGGYGHGGYGGYGADGYANGRFGSKFRKRLRDTSDTWNARANGQYDNGSAFKARMNNFSASFEQYLLCKFGFLIPTGCGGAGCPPWGHYARVYPIDPYYADQRDGQIYSAQGYGTPVAVPLAPVVGHTYNYSWGVPASRLTPISHVAPY